MLSRLTWYQASKYLHHNSVKKNPRKQHTTVTCHNKLSSAQVTDALLEPHTQSSVLNPRPAELRQATIQEHGLKFQKSSPVHSTWESKLDQDKSASFVSGDAISLSWVISQGRKMTIWLAH